MKNRRIQERQPSPDRKTLKLYVPQELQLNCHFYVSENNRGQLACKCCSSLALKTIPKEFKHVEMSIKVYEWNAMESLPLQTRASKIVKARHMSRWTQKEHKIMKVGSRWSYVANIFLHVHLAKTFYDISHVADTLCRIPSATLTDFSLENMGKVLILFR